MHDFLKRIERQQPQRRVDAAIGAAAVGVPNEQPRQRVHGALAELVAARRQPVVVRRLARVDSFQELSDVQRGRALQRLAAVVVDEPLELERVDVDAAGGQLEGLRGPCDQLVVVEVQRAAQHQERLAQARAGLPFSAVAPQQRGELGAGVRATRLEREVGEQRLRLLRRQRQRLSGRSEDLQSTERQDPEPCHASTIGAWPL